MRPQRRRRRKIHRIRISRDTVIAEQRPSTQLEIRREPPAPLKIPLQSQRIESHPISRIRRLKNQIRRHRIHRILKSPPQKSRQMRPRNHPPITQSRIKDSRPRSPTRHRVPTPGPNLHLMPALFRTRIGLSKARTRGRDHKREAQERRNQKTTSRFVRPMVYRVPHPTFCKPATRQHHCRWVPRLSSVLCEQPALSHVAGCDPRPALLNLTRCHCSWPKRRSGRARLQSGPQTAPTRMRASAPEVLRVGRTLLSVAFDLSLCRSRTTTRTHCAPP